MPLGTCRASVEEKIGRELNTAELTELDRIIDNAAERMSGRTADETTEQIVKELNEAAEQLEIAAIIEQRNAALNFQKEIQLANTLIEEWSDAPGEGLQAFLLSSNIKRKGARDAVATSQEALSHQYVMGMAADLEKAGVMEHGTKGKFDDEIYKAAYQLNRIDGPDETIMKGFQKESIEVAKIVNKFTEAARQDANKAGAFINKADGYVTTQTHDLFKIRAAGKEKWKESITDLMDWDKTMKGVSETQRSVELDRMYKEFSEGSHVSLDMEPNMTGLKGFGNVGKRMSRERVLKFKDAEAELAYHQEFGTGTLMENVFHQLEKSGAQTALMRKLGPNPRQTLDNAIERVRKDAKVNDGADMGKFDEKVEWIERRAWPNITHENRIPGNHMWAQRSSMLRAVEMMADLGGATISAVGDVAFSGSEYRFQGGSMVSGVLKSLGNIVQGVPSKEKIQILSELSVHLDSVTHSLSRFDASRDMPGLASKAVQKYFKFNLLRKWTDNQRSGFAMMASHRLGSMKNKEFSEMPEGLSSMLEGFGIDAGKWDIYRQGESSFADGKDFLTPEGLKYLPDDLYANYLTSKNVKPTAARIKNLREEMNDQFRSYFFDRATTATIEPNAAVRAATIGGTKPGTVEGEALRHFFMYKSFMVGVAKKILGRELHGYSAETKSISQLTMDMIGLGSDKKATLGFANVLAWSAVSGYAALAIRDMIAGREPRDITEDPAGVITKSMVQGGGMGLYGDFLFGEMHSRYGMSALGSFMGPTFGRASTPIDMWYGLNDDDTETRDVAGRAFKELWNTVPGNNLFYTKWATDYMIGHNISEWASPGYLRRTEKRIKDNTGQDYWNPPSEQIPYGGNF